MREIGYECDPSDKKPGKRSESQLLPQGRFILRVKDSNSRMRDVPPDKWH